MQEILFYIFVVSFLIQMMYYWVIFGRLVFFYKKNGSDEIKTLPKPISIIICAKNEAENIKKNLPHILNQNHPNFEVIVVNDNSTDETETVLELFLNKNPHLRILNVPPNSEIKGKKNALSYGIKHSKNDTLLLTDADCCPNSRDWAKIMGQGVSENKKIVLGYGPYYFQKNWVNYWVQYETFLTAIQYFSWAFWGLPYMGVGRNMAYSKELFEKSGGFKSHYYLASGDDDLFVSKVANSQNTKIELSHKTHCYSPAPDTFLEWYSQKKRHYSTSSSYKLRHILALGLFSFSHIIFVLLLMCQFFYNEKNIFVYIAFILFIMSIFLVSKKFNILLEKKDNSTNILFFTFIHPLYYLIFATAIFFNKSVRWK